MRGPSLPTETSSSAAGDGFGKVTLPKSATQTLATLSVAKVVLGGPRDHEVHMFTGTPWRFVAVKRWKQKTSH